MNGFGLRIPLCQVALKASALVKRRSPVSPGASARCSSVDECLHAIE